MEFTEGPFSLFKSSEGLAEFIVRIINDRVQGIVQTVSNPKKPFCRVTTEQLDSLVNDSGLSRGTIANKFVLANRRTLDNWFRNPSSLTLDNFEKTAVACAEAAYGNPQKEDAVYLDLMEILLPRMSTSEELEIMRASAVGRINQIAPTLSDADLSALLDHAVSLERSGSMDGDHQIPPSHLLREASGKLRAEVEERQREELRKRVGKLSKN